MPSTPIAILAVDDDVEDLELIQDSFFGIEPSAKFKILTNANWVLPYLDRLSDTDLPCLIILDYNMPEMTGAQVITQLSNVPRYEPIPKIIFSTSNVPTHIDECMNKGATKYYVKPHTLNDLNRIAQEMLLYCKVGNFTQ